LPVGLQFQGGSEKFRPMDLVHNGKKVRREENLDPSFGIKLASGGEEEDSIAGDRKTGTPLKIPRGFTSGPGPWKEHKKGKSTFCEPGREHGKTGKTRGRGDSFYRDEGGEGQ